jgi:aryl-alcohol dehydrogenase-like predicted oxidoreductase
MALANSERWDHSTSVEEIMIHLHALVMARQVLYLGASDIPAWVVVKANMCKLDNYHAWVSQKNYADFK